MEGRSNQIGFWMLLTLCWHELLDAKNGARDRVLHMSSIGNRKEFRKHQSIVKCAVDASKEEWKCKVDAEKGSKDG